MRKRFDKKKAEEGIDVIAERFFHLMDDMRAAPCPVCKISAGLEFTPEGRHVRVSCATPLPTSPDGLTTCDFEAVIYATSVSDMPPPCFSTITQPKKI